MTLFFRWAMDTDLGQIMLPVPGGQTMVRNPRSRDPLKKRLPRSVALVVLVVATVCFLEGVCRSVPEGDPGFKGSSRHPETEALSRGPRFREGELHYLDQDRRHHPEQQSSFSSILYNPSDPAASSRKFSPDQLRHLFRSAGCVNDEIRLECRKEPQHGSDSIVVIENATFYPVLLPPEIRPNCSDLPIGPLGQDDPLFTSDFRMEAQDAQGRHPGGQQGVPGPNPFLSYRTVMDLRQALNGRCSGMAHGNQCTFNLHLDHEESQRWGPGLVDIFFRCVAKEETNSACSSSDDHDDDDPRPKSEVRMMINSFRDRGFLMSPAYPKYYKGGQRCRWSLRGRPGQRVTVRLLDVSLREGSGSPRSDHEDSKAQGGHDCSVDSVRISEQGKTLLRMCGESKVDLVLKSQANKVEVKVIFQAFSAV